MQINSKKSFPKFEAIDIEDVKDKKDKELYKIFKKDETTYMVLSREMETGDFVYNLQKCIRNAKEAYSIDFESFTKFGIEEDALVNMIINAIYFGERVGAEFKYEEVKRPEQNLVIDDKKFKKEITEAKNIAEASWLVRHLQDLPICMLRSHNFVEELKKAFKPLKNVELIVHDRKWLEEKGMNLLLGVNAASEDEPYLVEARYITDKSKETTALVGKGVMFDSGGYNLKPTPHMRWMKFDMSGAATVMGTVLALATNKEKTNVIALACIVANEIGPKGQHPDDVWKSYSGRYVEIDNTDAEGRLAMADGIAYVVKDLKPEFHVNRLIDISTLTGAMIYALGETFTGVWTTKNESWEKYHEAARLAGEMVWRMPFHKDFRDMLHSEIADIMNSVSKPEGGSSRAAEFLHFFVEQGIDDYVHLDVAGTSVRDNMGRAAMLRTMYNFVK